MTAPTYVVAEAGVNHNGSLDMALQLVDVTAETGADAVKFQTFRADRLTTRNAAKADYQKRTTGDGGSQYEMLKALELTDDMHRKIQKRCQDKGIDFLSTPFDIESLDYLVDEIGCERIKVPSGEITNGPLLLETGRKAKRIILSTGMATLAEIEAALAVLVWSSVHPTTEPNRQAEIWDCYAEHGTRSLTGRVTLLHCTTEYPAAFEDTNLRAMDTIQQAFGLEVGFSDHTEGIVAPIAAVARGAVLVEKHFTLDRGLSGPDHAASLEPGDLSEMVTAIRAVEAALGNGRKVPTRAELANRDPVRKSIVAACPIAPGEIFSPANMSTKRPGTGISPMLYWDMQGRPASVRHETDEPIV